MPRCYSYTRFSTPDQERGDSLTRQTKAAQEWAQREGMELDTETFHDAGVSAFRGMNAEVGALKDFRRRVEDGIIPRGSYLLIENTDRLTRLPAFDASQLLGSLVAEDIAVVDLATGTVYNRDTLNKDPNAFLLFILGAMRAHGESLRKSGLLKAKWERKREAAQNGTPITSKAPEWLELDKAAGTFTVREDKAAIIRRIYDMAAEGMAPNAITTTLNSEGVPSLRGRKWHRQQVAALLDSPTPAGTYVPHTTEYDEDGRMTRKPADPIHGYYPAIVSEEVFQAVRALRSKDKNSRRVSKAPRGRHAGSPVRNLFSGLLRCEHCEALHTRTQKSVNHAYLVCSNAKDKAGCKYRLTKYDRVERVFIARAAEVLALAPAGELDSTLSTELEQTESNLEALELAAADLRQAIRHKSSAALTTELGRILEEVDALRQQRDELQRRQSSTMGPLVLKRLEKLEALLTADTLDKRAANVLMRQLLDRIVLDRSNGQLVFHWKWGAESSLIWAWPESDEFAA